MAVEVFDYINSHRLVELINAARTRLLVVAPAISSEVAVAIIKAASRVQFLRVVLDPNEWVYRIGFGEIEGLRRLEEAHVQVSRSSGLRIGFIDTDDAAYVFSPIPQTLETEPTHRQTPNAIRIDAIGAERIITAIAPDFVNSSNTPEIGAVKMMNAEIEMAEEALRLRPPVPPDLSRQITVLSSEFQFVETNFTGGRIHQRTFSLTAKDLGVRRKNLSKRIAGTFKIIEGAQIKELDAISEKLQKIRRRYLIQVKHYGMVIDYRQKERFKNAMDGLITELDAVKKHSLARLASKLDKSKQMILPLLVRNLKAIGKTELKKKELDPGELSPENLEAYVSRDLEANFPRAEELLSEMRCSYEFRLIAPEHLGDKRFCESIEKALKKPLAELARQEQAVGVKTPIRPQLDP